MLFGKRRKIVAILYNRNKINVCAHKDSKTV